MSVHLTLYKVFTLLTLPVRLITWWIWYIPKFNRPNSEWSWKTSVSLQAAKAFLSYQTTTRYRTPKSLEPGPDGDRFIVLHPQMRITDPSLKSEVPVYQGTITSIPSVQPGPVGAVWYPSTPVQPPQKSIIHFHPSAFVVLGARPGDGCGWGPTKFSERTGWPVLSIQYRLSLDADKCFPAAVQDGLTAYIYALETLKIPASQIVLSGESAGGNLIVAMLRYITLENQAIPLPRCALLWSPWVDLAEASLQRLVHHPNYKTDYVTYEFGHWGASGYVPTGWSDTDPYISPLGRECPFKCPLFIEAGTAEVLHDDIAKFANNMKEIGTEVELRQAPNASHAIFGMGIKLGMPEVSISGHEQAANFIERVGNE